METRILNVPEELDGWVFLVWYPSLLHIEQLHWLNTLDLLEDLLQHPSNTQKYYPCNTTLQGHVVTGQEKMALN